MKSSKKYEVSSVGIEFVLRRTSTQEEIARSFDFQCFVTKAKRLGMDLTRDVIVSI